MAISGTSFRRLARVCGALLLTLAPAFAQSTFLQKYLAASSGVYVWVSDNNLTNTSLYRVTTPGQSTLLTTIPGGVVEDMGEINGVVITEVLANNTVSVWRSDGTPGGTFAFPGTDALLLSASPLSGTQLNGYLYFGNFGPNKESLWRTNGTSAELVADFTNTSIYDLEGIQALNGQLYLRVLNTSVLLQIWSSNGQPGFPNLLTTLSSTDFHWSAPPTWLVGLGTDLIFSVVGPGTGATVFRLPQSGGTAVQLAQVSQGYTDLGASIGPRAYFRLFDNIHGYELWSSDGTSAGTGLVKSLAPGKLNSTPRDFTAFNNLCYFLADNSLLAPPSGFFSTDGTSQGTVAIYNPRGPGQLTGLRLVQGAMFFLAPASFTGFQLVISDGTPSGTRPVQISPVAFSPQGLNDVSIQANGANYYFNYITTTNNLYRTDGTPGGTVLLGQF